MFSRKNPKHIISHHQHNMKKHIMHLKNIEKQKIRHELKGAAKHSSHGLPRRQSRFSFWKFLFWLIVLGIFLYWINSFNCTSWHIWTAFC